MYACGRPARPTLNTCGSGSATAARWRWEIGLDGFMQDQPARCSCADLEAQLRLARAFELPAVLHIRRAQDEILKLLRRILLPGHRPRLPLQRQPAAGGGLHPELGFRLGFGGAMTYTGSHASASWLAGAAPSAIVLETDAPGHPARRGRQRNDPVNPALLRRTRDAAGMPMAEVVEATCANAVAAIPAGRPDRVLGRRSAEAR